MVYDFNPGRSGEYARNFLGHRKGKLVCDDYGGHQTCFALGVTKIGCMAHARQVLRVTRHQKSILAEHAFQLCLKTNKETWTAI
ncbi:MULTISPECIES: transposase [Pseudomonas]|uniref:Transposase n=1 Tax=Pseudomonas bubulae TaxID=2316085 RepID=A0ABZ2H2W1_9PSED|nr:MULTISPECIES: transposase [Pseudomonas]